MSEVIGDWTKIVGHCPCCRIPVCGKEVGGMCSKCDTLLVLDAVKTTKPLQAVDIQAKEQAFRASLDGAAARVNYNRR